MRSLIVCLLAALPAFAQYPPGVAVKVSEYVMVDGRKIGIAEWSDLLAKAVPCEVQGQPKAARCKKCGDDCRCVGGCGCEAAAKAAKPCTVCADCDCGSGCVCDREKAARAAKVERPRTPAPAPAVALPSNETPLWIDWSDGSRTLGTVGDYLRMGGDPLKIRTTTVQAPVAQPMPVYAPPVYYSQPYSRPAFSTGFQFQGPFGGGVSAGACVGGR